MLQTIPRETLETLAPVMVGNGRSVILVGPPGTGKSTLAANTANKMGRRYVKFACHADATMQEATLSAFPWKGNWQPIVGAILLAWGYTVDSSGAVVRTNDGGILCLDDMQNAGPGLQAAMFTALDRGSAGKQFVLPDGTVATPGSQYGCFGTMNGSHLDLDPAIRDRAVAIVPVLQPCQDAIDTLHPLVQDLCTTDYDGNTANPVATFREWQSLSELWADFERIPSLGKPEALAYAVLAALGESPRAQKMLEAIVTHPHSGPYRPMDALRLIQSGLPSGAPV
jgi:hypothetical protein